MIRKIFALQKMGKGEKTIMICSPNDPQVIEKQVTFYMDTETGMYKEHIVKSKRYKHPIKTVDQWCNIFRKEGYK